MDSAAETDADLLHRATARDSDALRTLLKRHGPKVRDAIRGKIDARWRSLLDEDDLMQVTYLEAFLHIDQLSARTADSFTGWLIRIANNALLDAIKGLESQKRPQPARRVQVPDYESSCVALIELLGATTTTPSRHAAGNEAGRSIEAALKTLPEDYGTVVRQCDLEGKSAAEVSALMGRSVGAIHMLRARAHAALQSRLGAPSNYFSDTP